jgi:hypothetical protein
MSIEHGFKPGSEITVLGRAYRGRARVEYYLVRIERVVRVTKTLIVSDRARHKLGDRMIRLATDEDRQYLAPENLKREAARQQAEKRQAHMEELRSLFHGLDVAVTNSNQDGRYDLCGLSEEQLRFIAEQLRRTPFK